MPCHFGEVTAVLPFPGGVGLLTALCPPQAEVGLQTWSPGRVTEAAQDRFRPWVKSRGSRGSCCRQGPGKCSETHSHHGVLPWKFWTSLAVCKAQDTVHLLTLSLTLRTHRLRPMHPPRSHLTQKPVAASLPSAQRLSSSERRWPCRTERLLLLLHKPLCSSECGPQTGSISVA